MTIPYLNNRIALPTKPPRLAKSDTRSLVFPGSSISTGWSPTTQTSQKSTSFSCLWPLAGCPKARVGGRRRLPVRRRQVCPLTQSFSVSFLWKIIDLPGGQINDPWSGDTIFLLLLPATRLCLRPLKGFLSWHVAFQGPATLRCF